MGLLSRITNDQISDNSKKSTVLESKSEGLLVKATNDNSKNIFSFQEWAKTKGFEHCALFSNVHGMMVITNAYNVDCSTIEKSVSSLDFWKGTLDNKSDVFTYKKTDQAFYNFLQFFSFELKNLITNICFIKFIPPNSKTNDFSILMIFNTSSNNEVNFSKETINDIVIENKHRLFNFHDKKIEIEKTLKSNSIKLFSFDIKDSVNKTIHSSQLPEENIKQAVLFCIYEQAFTLINSAFISPSLVSFKNKTNIKIAFSDISDIDATMLQTHINLLLSNLLCNTKIKSSLVAFGVSNDSEEIIKFLN